MNKYEIMFIVKPDVEEETRNALIENFKNILTNGEGTVDNVNEWGLRDFAYEIQDYKKGYYVVIDTTTTPANQRLAGFSFIPVRRFPIADAASRRLTSRNAHNPPSGASVQAHPLPDNRGYNSRYPRNSPQCPIP